MFPLKAEIFQAPKGSSKGQGICKAEEKQSCRRLLRAEGQGGCSEHTEHPWALSWPGRMGKD